MFNNLVIFYPMKYYSVYIMANRRNGTIYVGVTSQLVQRVWQHKQNIVPGFTQRYKIHQLVYYETFNDIRLAIMREKKIKKLSRAEKINLIELANPEWRDLYNKFL